MIPKFDGSNLSGADGAHLGCVRDRTLVRLVHLEDWDDSITFCAFAIMEYGGLFDTIQVNVLENGVVFSMRTEDVRKTNAKDGMHILKFSEMELI
tara:strand:+ start:176 stop:460 length:285 start_codon:yes stop_codon:yes gene_type:complete